MAYVRKIFYAINAIVLWTFTAVATGITVFGAKGPASFPIIRGIDTAVCVPSSSDTASLDEQRRFLGDLENHKRRIVFINDLSIYGYGNWGSSGGKLDKNRFRKECSNDDYELFDNTLKNNSGSESGELILSFKRVDPQMAATLLEVRAPKGEAYLVDTACGENCFGAHGLYKVLHSTAEGFSVYKLEPFPATAGVLDAYECTLAKLNAKWWWQSFIACRF